MKVTVMPNKKSKPQHPDGFRGFESFREVAQPLPVPEGKQLIKVYVEGYDDVAFWRGIFDDFENRPGSRFMFEISVPLREDLAKGKKVVLNLAAEADFRSTIFCVDSDFDYLFADQTDAARFINTRENVFHTYAYATENYLCYAPSLHNICVRATKNDTRIFDFEEFFREYSKCIFRVFLWYAYSAQTSSPNIFPLLDFKAAVKVNYLDFPDNGRSTLEWIGRHTQKKLETLEEHHPKVAARIPQFEQQLRRRGVREDNCYMYMHGHTLMDNVVMPVLDGVCDRLRYMSSVRINTSARRGVSLVNEQSNYKNAQQDIRAGLLFNENYKGSDLYGRLKDEIFNYLKGLEEEF